jgi:excisionase family DNA binding protein
MDDTNSAIASTTGENLWDADRTGEYLRLSRCTVLRKARRGSIPYRKLEGGAVRFVPSEVRRWADSQPGPRFGKARHSAA